MRFTFQHNNDKVASAQLLAELQECRNRSEMLLSAVLALINCVKEFSFGLAEINADAFARQMEELKQQMNTERGTAGLRRAFNGQPEAIDAFIQRERAYLEEREREYQAIIDLLRGSLTSLFEENQGFTRSLDEQSLQLEHITYLDDIRRIKERLRGQVETMRSTVAKKAALDRQRMDRLSREAVLLRKNLERVIDISQTDTLTGASNRLAFDLMLQRMIDRFSLTRGARFCLLMCDLDNFKVINDTYGHPVGDRVLKSFVAECRAYFREEDFIARYGGEEFAIILPGATLSDARRRAQLFCKRLAGRRFRIYADRPGENLSFTTSIGVSEIHRDDTIETLLGRADRALYQAKACGKNRAVCEQDAVKAARKKPAPC
ncbi:MAG: Response regulator PleD [bacterium ADurb.Bin429]|nr:MAG: Response regulator PleD [bacterium ADurb.Bin429]